MSNESIHRQQRAGTRGDVKKERRRIGRRAEVYCIYRRGWGWGIQDGWMDVHCHELMMWGLGVYCLFP